MWESQTYKSLLKNQPITAPHIKVRASNLFRQPLRLSHSLLPNWNLFWKLNLSAGRSRSPLINKMLSLSLGLSHLRSQAETSPAPLPMDANRIKPFVVHVFLHSPNVESTTGKHLLCHLMDSKRHWDNNDIVLQMPKGQIRSFETFRKVSFVLLWAFNLAKCLHKLNVKEKNKDYSISGVHTYKY